MKPARHRSMICLSRVASMCLLAVLALGGCGQNETDASSPGDEEPASPTSAPADPDSPTSDDATEPTREPDPPSGGRLAPLDGSEPAVRWTPSGFEVRAFGSSSCPPVATGVVVQGESSVVIDVEPEQAGACTDDLAPHNSFVKAPDGLDRKEPLLVRLRGESGLTKPIEVRFINNTRM